MYDDEDEGLDQMIGGVNMASGDNESVVALSDGLSCAWINAKERLPVILEGEDDSKHVLLYDGKFSYVGYLVQWDKEAAPYFLQFGRDGYLAEGITHWMPLPESPKAR